MLERKGENGHGNKGGSCVIVFIFFVSKSSRVNYNNVISLDSLVNSGFRLYPLDIPLGFSLCCVSQKARPFVK